MIKKTGFASIIKIKKKNDKADLVLVDNELHHAFDQYQTATMYRCRELHIKLYN